MDSDSVSPLPGAAFAAPDWIRHFVNRHEVDSTNTLARELVARQELMPLLVLADFQTSGRGRGNKRWWSPLGSLAFSVAFSSNQPPADQSLYALAVANCVARALSNMFSDLAIELKWPNDVILMGKKIAGILIERQWRPAALIVGVGVNLDALPETVPKDVRETAAAVSDLYQTSISRDSVLAQILAELNQLRSQPWNPAGIVSEFRSRCFLTGKQIRIEIGDRIAEGKCHGIGDSGELLIDRDGEISAFVSGTVRLV